jgi:hypothetical protein
MTGINQKTALVAIVVITTVLAVSAIAIGNVHNASADTDTKTVTKNIKNTGINVPTDTDQKQDCQTVGGTSGISGSCQATSTDKINQTGGQLTR